MSWNVKDITHTVDLFRVRSGDTEDRTAETRHVVERAVIHQLVHLLLRGHGKGPSLTAKPVAEGHVVLCTTDVADERVQGGTGIPLVGLAVMILRVLRVDAEVGPQRTRGQTEVDGVERVDNEHLVVGSIVTGGILLMRDGILIDGCEDGTHEVVFVLELDVLRAALTNGQRVGHVIVQTATLMIIIQFIGEVEFTRGERRQRIVNAALVIRDDDGVAEDEADMADDLGADTDDVGVERGVCLTHPPTYLVGMREETFDRRCLRGVVVIVLARYRVGYHEVFTHVILLVFVEVAQELLTVKHHLDSRLSRVIGGTAVSRRTLRAVNELDVVVVAVLIHRSEIGLGKQRVFGYPRLVVIGIIFVEIERCRVGTEDETGLVEIGVRSHRRPRTHGAHQSLDGKVLLVLLRLAEVAQQDQRVVVVGVTADVVAVLQHATGIARLVHLLLSPVGHGDAVFIKFQHVDVVIGRPPGTIGIVVVTPQTVLRPFAVRRPVVARQVARRQEYSPPVGTGKQRALDTVVFKPLYLTTIFWLAVFKQGVDFAKLRQSPATTPALVGSIIFIDKFLIDNGSVPVASERSALVAVLRLGLTVGKGTTVVGYLAALEVGLHVTEGKLDVAEAKVNDREERIRDFRVNGVEGVGLQLLDLELLDKGRVNFTERILNIEDELKVHVVAIESFLRSHHHVGGSGVLRVFQIAWRMLPTIIIEERCLQRDGVVLVLTSFHRLQLDTLGVKIKGTGDRPVGYHRDLLQLDTRQSRVVGQEGEEHRMMFQMECIITTLTWHGFSDVRTTVT